MCAAFPAFQDWTNSLCSTVPPKALTLLVTGLPKAGPVDQRVRRRVAMNALTAKVTLLDQVAAVLCVARSRYPTLRRR